MAHYMNVGGKQVLSGSDQRRRAAKASETRAAKSADRPKLEGLSGLELEAVKAELAAREDDAQADIARVRAEHARAEARRRDAERDAEAVRLRAELVAKSEANARHRATVGTNSEAFLLSEIDRLSAAVARLTSLVTGPL